MTFESIALDWADQIAAGGARQRRVDGHSLALYFGADNSSRPVFFLITEEEPVFPAFSSVVSVEKGRREDKRWTVVLTLRERSLTASFMGLCTELARRSGVSTDPHIARTIFFATLQDWRALLSGREPRRLSESQVRGLLAEMWFGMNILSTRFTISALVLTWIGPYGAPQDFQTPDGALFEVKSVHTGSRTVEISSVDQLDPPSGESLVLSLVDLDEVPSGTSDSFTLASLVGDLVGQLGGDLESIRGLNHRLDALSIDLSDNYYDDHSYVVRRVRHYSVRDAFPRIKREHVPLAVGKITYQLQIEGFSDYVAPVWGEQ